MLMGMTAVIDDDKSDRSTALLSDLPPTAFQTWFAVQHEAATRARQQAYEF